MSGVKEATTAGKHSRMNYQALSGAGEATIKAILGPYSTVKYIDILRRALS